MIHDDDVRAVLRWLDVALVAVFLLGLLVVVSECDGRRPYRQPVAAAQADMLHDLAARD
ncbi:MAG TPA: hypothetical protein VD978_13755 [Azospirillum sp.]|nr:hypothetical protein [Azospirillum sp.]